MFKEEFSELCHSARQKANFLRKNPLGYFLASVLAGAYVGFGILLIFTIGGPLADYPFVKTIMGATFGIASLVTMAGAELFTGNVLVMFSGLLRKTVKLREVLKLWLICYLGNWLGAALLSFVFHLTGLNSGVTGAFIEASALSKMQMELIPLLSRSFLCSMLVCLGTWCAYRCKSEIVRLMMIFLTLFAFIATGFEHSIANMTLLTTALFHMENAAASLGGYFYKLLVSTLGNILGSILCVALPYHVISRERES